MNIKISRKELYNYINQICNGNYSIGFHGIANYRLGSEVEAKTALEVQKSILDNGLFIKHGRKLLGTVQFKDEKFDSEEQFINSYKYGDVLNYAIVALPKTITNSKGESIYVGRPTYDSLYKELEYTQGYQLTSLADSLLPNYQEQNSVLDTCFILGTMSIDGDDVFIELNDKHIAFNGGIVSDDYFETRRKMLYLANLTYNLTGDFKIDKNIDSLNSVFDYMADFISRIDYLSEEELNRLNNILNNVDYQTSCLIEQYAVILNNTIDIYKNEINLLQSKQM